MPQRIREDNIRILTHSGVTPKHFKIELLGLAYCIVMQYSNIESTELSVYMHMLGGSESDSFKIYLDQTTLTHKNKTIATMSRLKLNDEAMDKLAALRKDTSTIRKFRDKLCHWQPFQTVIEPNKIPPPCESLELFNPPESFKGDKATSGYYRFSKKELIKTLHEANKIGKRWIDYEIQIIKHPESMLK